MVKNDSSGNCIKRSYDIHVDRTSSALLVQPLLHPQYKALCQQSQTNISTEPHCTVYSRNQCHSLQCCQEHRLCDNKDKD